MAPRSELSSLVAPFARPRRIRASLEVLEPKMLQWLTGSIGLHHIHHVQPRIPFYNLQRCQDAVPAFQAVPPLTLRRSLDSLRLRLVDETERRMVSYVVVTRPERDAAR